MGQRREIANDTDGIARGPPQSAINDNCCPRTHCTRRLAVRTAHLTFITAHRQDNFQDAERKIIVRIRLELTINFD